MLERGFEFAPGYRLEGFLGRGQFGQVWRVTAPGGTVGAVKFIDLADGQWEKEYEGIRRVKQIRHANLMPITAIWLLDEEGKVLQETSQEALDTVDLDDSGRSSDWVLSHQGRDNARWLAVAMLLGGQSLQHRLQECLDEGLPGIPVKELLSYTEESAKGLDFLNSRVHDFGSGSTSLQHCDVKPANIVLIGSSAVICDFGLARIMARDQVTATSVAGTPAYMAPEVIGGKPSRNSDQYSLAVTYYQLRTGELPMSDGTLWEVLDAHRLGKLQFDGVSESEREVLRRATSLEWEERFDSNQEMVETLREALRPAGTLPSIAPAPAAAPPLRRWRWRTLTTIAVVLLVAGVSFWLFPGQSDPENVPIDTRPLAGSNGSEGPIEEDQEKAPLAPVEHEELQAVLRLVDSDDEAARQRFRELLDRDPTIAQPTPVRLLGHQRDLLAMRIFGREQNVLLTSADESTLMRFDLERLSQLADSDAIEEFEGVALQAHNSFVEQLKMSSSNRWCAASGAFDTEVLIWDSESTEPTPADRLSGYQDDITAIAWHPSRPFLVTASADAKITIWSVNTSSNTLVVNNNPLRQFDVERAMVQMEFDPFGETLVCRDVDKNLKAISWEAVEKSLRLDKPLEVDDISTPGSSVRIFSLVGSPAGNTQVISGGDSGEIGFWDLQQRRLQERINDHSDPVVVCGAWNDEDDWKVVSGDDHGILVLWLPRRSHRRLPGHSESIADLDLSSDGRWLAAAAWDGTVSLRDLDGDPEKLFLSLRGDGGRMRTVRIDPSGRWLFGGGADGRIYAWDLRLAKLLTWTRPTQAQPPVEHDQDDVKQPDPDLVTQR